VSHFQQLVDTKLGEESKDNAAFSAAQTAVADPLTEKAAAGEVVAGEMPQELVPAVSECKCLE